MLKYISNLELQKITDFQKMSYKILIFETCVTTRLNKRRLYLHYNILINSYYTIHTNMWYKYVI